MHRFAPATMKSGFSWVALILILLLGTMGGNCGDPSSSGIGGEEEIEEEEDRFQAEEEEDETLFEVEEDARLNAVDETDRQDLCDAYTDRAATVWTISGIKVPVCSLLPFGSGPECDNQTSQFAHVHRRVYGFSIGDGSHTTRSDPARFECGHGKTEDLDDSEEMIVLTKAQACAFALPICW